MRSPSKNTVTYNLKYYWILIKNGEYWKILIVTWDSNKT